MFNKFPYTDFHEMNLDFILKRIQELSQTVESWIAFSEVKFADPIEWTSDRYYQKNTIVLDTSTGDSYLSKKEVPAGVLLTNTKFWYRINYGSAQSVEYVRFFSNIETLNAGNVKAGEKCRTLGYNTVNDGGSMTYTISDSADGAIYFIELDNGLYAIPIYENHISPEQLGSFKDGSADDSDIIELCIEISSTYNIPITGNGIYKISRLINLSSCEIDMSSGKILTTNNGGLIIDSVSRKSYDMPVIENIDSINSYGLCVKNSNHNNIYIKDITGYDIGLYLLGDSNNGEAYNSIYIKTIHNCKNLIRLEATENGWVNQNQFYNGRLYITSDYEYKETAIMINMFSNNSHDVNGNTFYSLCLETNFAKMVEMNNCRYNYFYSCRYEGNTSSKINLVNSRFNMFIGGYSLGLTTVTDDSTSSNNCIISNFGTKIPTSEGKFILTNTSDTADTFKIQTYGIDRNIMSSSKNTFKNYRGETMSEYTSTDVNLRSNGKLNVYYGDNVVSEVSSEGVTLSANDSRYKVGNNVLNKNGVNILDSSITLRNSSQDKIKIDNNHIQFYDDAGQPSLRYRQNGIAHADGTSIFAVEFDQHLLYNQAAWNGTHLLLGSVHLWYYGGDLWAKYGSSPTSPTDGKRIYQH